MVEWLAKKRVSIHSCLTSLNDSTLLLALSSCLCCVFLSNPNQFPLASMAREIVEWVFIPKSHFFCHSPYLWQDFFAYTSRACVCATLRHFFASDSISQRKSAKIRKILDSNSDDEQELKQKSNVVGRRLVGKQTWTGKLFLYFLPTRPTLLLSVNCEKTTTPIHNGGNNDDEVDRPTECEVTRRRRESYFNWKFSHNCCFKIFLVSTCLFLFPITVCLRSTQLDRENSALSLSRTSTMLHLIGEKRTELSNVCSAPRHSDNFHLFSLPHFINIFFQLHIAYVQHRRQSHWSVLWLARIP